MLGVLGQTDCLDWMHYTVRARIARKYRSKGILRGIFSNITVHKKGLHYHQREGQPRNICSIRGEAACSSSSIQGKWTTEKTKLYQEEGDSQATVMKHLLICMLIICIAHLAASTDKDGKDFNTRENEKVKQMTKNDAMRVADKALGDKDGWAVDGGASVKTRQWAVSAGKTVYESDNKMAKLAVGVAAHGRDGKVNDKQVGASFSWKF